MDASWQAVLDLLRLGLKGDSESVRQFGMRLLRRPPARGGDDGAFREALSRLLLAGAHAPAAGRAARGTPVAGARGGRPAPGEFAVPVDHETFAALARVDVLPHALAPVLPRDAADQLDRIIGERRDVEQLTRLGLDPARTLLLTGAPGVGKTMAARYLAGALGLPLLTLDLAAVVSSYLGKTGQNLRLALDAGRAEPCVLLLDEFDALAKRRDDPADVGELKRIVNVLLLEIERWPAGSLLVAATNHPELLDRAIWRRFDLVLALPLPDAAGRTEIARRLLSEHRYPASDAQLHALGALTPGASGSDLARLVRAAARRAALDAYRAGVAALGVALGLDAGPDAGAGEADALNPGSVVAGPGVHGAGAPDGAHDVFWSVLRGLALDRLREAARTDRAARAAYVGTRHHVEGEPSLRVIAAELGLTHPTASVALKEYDAQHAKSGRGGVAAASPAGGAALPRTRRARLDRAAAASPPVGAGGAVDHSPDTDGTATGATPNAAPPRRKAAARASRRNTATLAGGG